MTYFFFFKQKTAYEMRISDWSSDVCSSDLKRILDVIGESHVQILSENFLLSAHMAERSNMILTVPSRAAAIASPERVCLMKPPIDLPGFDVKQYWHERFDSEPVNIWLLSHIARIRQVEARTACPDRKSTRLNSFH